MGKICFLTSTLNYGGATKIMSEIANYLSGWHDVSILYYGEYEESFYGIDEKIKLKNIPKTKCKIPKIWLLAQIELIHRTLKKLSPDVVIAFGNTEKLMAICASFGLRKTKVIISERQDPFNYSGTETRIMRWKYKKADGCVFQTVGAANYFSKEIQNKSAIIPNFISEDVNCFKRFIDREKAISFSARFELKQKRQDIMVKAFKLVSEIHPEYKLYFYGDGEDLDSIKVLAKNLGLEEKVIFFGKVDHVNDKIKETRIFALTSDYEGIPNALLEAMAHGLAVVSTDCSPGGARLLIQDGVNGLLTPCGDIAQISAAIIKYIENPEFADACSIEAQKVVKTYSPGKILPKWKMYIESFM